MAKYRDGIEWDCVRQSERGLGSCQTMYDHGSVRGCEPARNMTMFGGLYAVAVVVIAAITVTATALAISDLAPAIATVLPWPTTVTVLATR
jgi:hypothetical protein